MTAMGTASNTLMPSKRTWKQYGQSGMWVSDWYPKIAEHVDDITMFRSCWADGLNHVGSVCQMNTGSILAGRPSMGAWVTYGLGAANRQSADLRHSDGRRRSGRRTEELEFGIPAGQLSGHAVPPRGRSDSGSGAAGDDRRRAAARPARSAEFAQSPLRRRQAGGHGTGGAAAAPTSWRTGCSRRRRRRWI